MGVTGLYPFLEKTNAIRKVNISELVNYHRSSKLHPPVIVVDALNLMYELYKYYHLPYLCGGQLKEYKEHLEYFIEIFKKKGISLTFYFDGPNVLFNIDGWITRRRRNIQSINTLFDKVEEGKALKHIESSNRNLVLPRNIWEVTIFVLKQKMCKIKIAVAECDKELAQYSCKNSCIAILAKDTDFVIYETVTVISTIGMNLDEMSFYIYDKNKVLEVLKLKTGELPLFASLVGNDFISRELLNGFHARLRKRGENFNPMKTYFAVAQYIRKLNLKFHSGKILENDMKNIANYVFQDVNKYELLQDSINFYNISLQHNGYEAILGNFEDTKWKNIVKMVYKDFSESGETSFIFSITGKQCLQLSNTLEDFRCSDIPPVAKVLKPLRKKLYGILLFEKPDMKSVKEWVVDGYHSLAEPEDVSPVFPKVHHSGLVYLLTAKDKKASLGLLVDMFKLSSAQVENIPDHMLIPALTFRYLKDIVAIHEWEMNALIVSASLVQYFNVNELKGIMIDKVSSRSIRLYNLVTSSYGGVLQVFQVLRNIISTEMMLPCNYQDGKLFHLIYKMSHDKRGSRNRILQEVLAFFRNKTPLYGTWREQVEKIAAFINL